MGGVKSSGQLLEVAPARRPGGLARQAARGAVRRRRATEEVPRRTAVARGVAWRRRANGP